MSKWTQETRDKVTNIELEKIRNTFPLEYSDNCILFLNDVNVIYKAGGNTYLVDLIDDSGYRYYINYHHVLSAKGRYAELNKFFKRNKYTKENINNYFKLNNISLRLINDIPCSGAAREKIVFVDMDNNNITASWNQIQHYPDRYKDNYYEVLKQKQELRSISKDEAIHIIYEMQSKLDRPIDSRDFRVKQENGIGIRTVLKYWKEVRFMQEELGLTVTGKHSKKLTKEEYQDDIQNICNQTFAHDNRKIITYADIRKYGKCDEPSTYARYCNADKTTLKDYISSLGFNLQKSGTGLNHHFKDGEKTTSLYEFEFSKFLRENGLTYNKDYFRDVKYKTFDKLCKENMNCDYLINLNGHSFYIELAGFLGNKSYQESYKNNTPIESKSKEKYRLDLNKKKEIFQRNNLDYYILLKDDMNINTYRKILLKYKKKVG